MGIIEKLGSAVEGYSEGQRVIAGAITPLGWSNASLDSCHSQCGAGTAQGWKAMGGWRVGNTIDGAQAEYLLVPEAMANFGHGGSWPHHDCEIGRLAQLIDRCRPFRASAIQAVPVDQIDTTGEAVF